MLNAVVRDWTVRRTASVVWEVDALASTRSHTHPNKTTKYQIFIPLKQF